MLIRSTEWGSYMAISLDGTIYNQSHLVRANGLHYVNQMVTAPLTSIVNDEIGNLSDSADSVANNVYDTKPILDKWMNLKPSLKDGGEYQNSGSLVSAKNIAVTDAIMTEIQPYWEQNLIYSYIANIYLTSDEILKVTKGWGERTMWNIHTNEWMVVEGQWVISLSGVALDYFENGANDVQEELLPYFDKPDVQAAFAESAMFLSLTQDQRFEYSAMSRVDQYEMLFITAERYDQYIQDNKELNLLSMSMVQLTNDHYSDIDLLSIGNRLAEIGIDGYTWFCAEFDEETQVVKYDAVNDAIDPIVRLYYGVLGRAPEKDGLEWWIKTFNTDDTKIIEQMAADFAWSKEFLGVDPQSGPTAEQLITAMYKNVLGREPDEDGYLWWLEKAELAFEYDLRAGNVPGTSEHTWTSPNNEEVFTFGRIVTGFTESQEFIDTSTVDVYASGIALWGPNYEDLVSNGTELGFTVTELIGVQTTHEEYFI